MRQYNRKSVATLLFLVFYSSIIMAQAVQDDFEGTGTISTWAGDDCGMDAAFANPLVNASNPSATVLKYDDYGGQYANVRFDVASSFDLSVNHTFTMMIYVPSSGITGSQPDQVSLKLQDGTLGSPWTSQCEIIKPIVTDQWQTVSFDFFSDPFINFDPGSLDPIYRTDFNRVLIQVNGENNFDLVIAYIDDLNYDGLIGGAPCGPVFDQLVWSDEFNTSGAIDGTKWHHQTQLPDGVSWYNGEVQHYTDRTVNSFADTGHLHIIAKKEVFTDQGQTKDYTSARLNSKFAFTYGRVEVRAKLPTGVGTWPAIWMLGKNITEPGGYWSASHGTTSWPACGEIDIMEHWGSNQDYVQSALHTPSSSGATINHGGLMATDVSNTFHTYSMEWDTQSIKFSIDGNLYYVYDPSPQNMNNWPFIADQYLLLNIAIEGSIDPAFTESLMIIDYVRIYQESTTTPTIDTHTACDSLTWIDGITYTGSNNTATYTLLNAVGCDSVITLNLTIDTVDTGITQSGSVLSADQTGASYQWLVCDSSYSAITGETGQSYNTISNGTYAVEITGAGGCVDTSACVTITSTGVLNEGQEPSIIVFPNPTNGNINLKSAGMEVPFEYNLFDLSGRIIQKGKILNANSSVILNQSTAGSYFLRIDKCQVLRVIIE